LRLCTQDDVKGNCFSQTIKFTFEPGLSTYPDRTTMPEGEPGHPEVALRRETLAGGEKQSLPHNSLAPASVIAH
jgi:hypothetical protein